jgi:hypothetical protein
MQMHMCGCRINLSGQNCHIVNYDQFNALSWPEVQVLQQLHGDENVMDIVPISMGDAVPSREKERLVAIYGWKVVEACFPGRTFHMQLMMTGDNQLPVHVEGAAPQPDPDDDDGDPGEVERNLAATTAAFRPSRAARPFEA